MRRVKQIAALLLAVLMLLALAACGKSGEQSANPGGQSETSGKSGDKQAPKETPAPEFVYTADYETLNLPEELGDFWPDLVTEDGFLSIVAEKVGERELYEGEELTWDGQLDIYENRLYKLGLDGKLTKLEGYEQMKLDNEELEEGHEISSGTSIVAREGGYLTLENVWESWSNAPEGTERYSDEWVMAMESRRSYYLRTLDETGKELSCVPLDTDALFNGGDGYFGFMAAAGEHQVLLASGEVLWLVDTETGKYIGHIDGVDWVQKILTLRDGRVMVVYYGNQEQRLAEIDLDKCKLGESYPVNGDFYTAVTGGGDYDIYYTNGENFYGFDVDNGKIEKLFNWINCDVDFEKISGGVTVTADGQVVGLCNEWDKKGEQAEVSFVKVNKVPYDSVPHKETLTLAVQFLDYYARSTIIDFNRKHDNVRIELRDYSEYNTNEDYNASLTKLRTEMLAGNVPDIIDLNGLPAKQFAAKGLLADLYPLIDADPELSREDFFPTVLKAMENDGKLYATCSGFYIVGAVGASRVVGKEPGWTYQQLMDALKEMPEGSTVFDYTASRYDVLRTCLAFDMDHFVDWNTGEVRFDSPAFIDLLNFTKTFPAEFDWENYEWSEEDDPYNRIREGRQMLLHGGLYGFDMLSQYENLFGGLDAFTFVGFPTSEGVGNMLSINAGYAISETCRNKEAAWDFVRVFMTEDYQDNNVVVSSFPSNIHSYETKRKDVMTPTYLKDENGRIMVDPETGEKMMEEKGVYWNQETQELVPIYSFTEEEIQKIEEIINNTDRFYSEDPAIFDIVKKQIDAFYSGQRSAEDVAKLIQSQARIYVNEQR